MTDEQIERALDVCANKEGKYRFWDCEKKCPYGEHAKSLACITMRNRDTIDYIVRLKSEKQLAETQLKELLSALYQRTDSEQGFTLYRKDIVELAKDYGIKEEKLK